MTKLKVKALPSGDNGRLLVRLNVSYRDGISRYGIARLTNRINGRSISVLILGHNDATGIFMPFDIRKALGVEKGEELDFTVRKVPFLGRVCWLLSTPDPAVHVPAWLAAVSLLLGVLGIFISLGK